MKFNVLPALLLGALALPAFATNIGLGYLYIAPDQPLGGLQQIQVFNLTGNDNCSDQYSACSSLNFSNWTMTIDYDSSYYNTPDNPVLASPLILTGDSVGIGPSVGGFPAFIYPLDLCGGAGEGCGSSPSTTISSITFTGTVTSGGSPVSSVCLFDDTNGNCSGGSNANITVNPTFTMTWDGSNSPSPYVDENTFDAQSPDITISNQVEAGGGGNDTPEPGTFWLSSLLALIPLARFIRSKSAA